MGAFPHSDIHGSTFICNSPWLFAACHVLLRRLMPRHPPYALFSLSLRILSYTIPSGNKKTFVSVLVLLLLQDIYFDYNFFALDDLFRYVFSL